MAYVNNGTERSLKVSVYKKVGGNYVQGYPKVYDGQQSWGDVNYPTLTDIQARQLSDADFSDRLIAFKTYVENIESGADFTTDVVGDGAIRSNTGLCLPTTTTTQRPVWSFSVRYSMSTVGACNGILDTAYSYSQFPAVGDTLYQDAAMTTPWSKGTYVLFVNPAIYGNRTVIVSIIDGSVYSRGQIMNTTSGYICNTTTSTTTTTTTLSPLIKVSCSNVLVNFDNYQPGRANEWSIDINLPVPAIVDTIFEVRWNATRLDASGTLTKTVFVKVFAGQTTAQYTTFDGTAQALNEDWRVEIVQLQSISPGTQFVSNC